MRLLIIEDQRDLADLVARGLRQRNFAVDVAYDGRTGLAKANLHPYDVVVLDRDLPSLHGDDVCRRLDRSAGTKVIMLTASGTIGDRVAGLELGADDYLPKPFAFKELAARIEALGRRSGPYRPPVLRHGDLELDTARLTVTRAGRPIALNGREFAVLRHLMSAGDRVVSSEELLARVWDENADPFSAVVRVTVMRLRRKLGEPSPIETVVGAGYRMA